ncbi:hypothetical protein GGX14DRAFT_408288 [Mycena pura]|uniref:Uncharacterized protein n=1 Tax=Mycena pura TaxID=153505 RepID=A0AAD6UQX8_9AGAR|nr:hypothetical protein GGX14DRAFT_408288 [Mycena pura]
MTSSNKGLIPRASQHQSKCICVLAVVPVGISSSPHLYLTPYARTYMLVVAELDVDGTARALGISTFAHLPSGAIFVRIAEAVDVNERRAEISKKTFDMFKNLQMEIAVLVRMMSDLTAVQCRGNASANGLNLDEDDENEYDADE